MSIELSEEELETLREVLSDYLADLHDEAQHTDNREYKETLRKEEEVIRRIQQKL